MKMLKFIPLVFAVAVLSACNGEEQKKVEVAHEPTILEKVDALVENVDKEIATFQKVVTLDHHRMAAEAGVYTPPSVAVLFSSATVNTNLIQQNQLIGLDLPFKVLCYSEPDTTKASLAYTSSEFIQKRHNLQPKDVAGYKTGMHQVVGSIPKEILSLSNLDSVSQGFGIVKIKSDFDYETTVQKLRDIIMSQGDTKWFGDVDYKKEASELDVELRPTILLLFGGPAPGGKAMVTSPKIGLDAFCQKLLVFENEEGEVWIAYNDIVAFANLYYQTSTKPQQLINKRLKMTFTKAVTKEV